MALYLGSNKVASGGGQSSDYLTKASDMTSENDIDNLKINYLTEEQYKQAKTNGQINENELYMTPDDKSESGGSSGGGGSQPVVLYNNEEGTDGDITLSESAANFTYLRIFYAINILNLIHTTPLIVYKPNGKKINLGGDIYVSSVEIPGGYFKCSKCRNYQ